MMASPSKVTSEHLRRLAYLYVRQSSLQQVHDHRESTARQYDLKRRAQALGWSPERKGTMSEAELHVLRARLLGGSLNKARRGELWMRPPIGLVIDRAGRLTLDPDAQIQSTVRLLFETFRRTGSALEVVRHFARERLLWPRRLVRGGRAGEIVFAALDHSRVLGILHNPRYAGAFVYGRTRQRKVIIAGQARFRRIPQADWKVFLPHTHPGYLSWEEFETNQATLLANANAYGSDRRRSPARKGVAWRSYKAR